jgi:hypothetical protein
VDEETSTKSELTIEKPTDIPFFQYIDTRKLRLLMMFQDD